jgi:tetratricopeptide (TPR) repeat protein
MAWFNYLRNRFTSKPRETADQHEDEFAARMRECWSAIQGKDSCRAMALVEEVLSYASEWCQQEMTEDVRLTFVASNCERQHDWDAAEAVYRTILELPDLEPTSRGHVHNHLGWLHSIRGRLIDALGEYRQATFYARQVDVPLCTAAALRQEIHCLIEQGDFVGSSFLLAEAMAISASDPRFWQFHAELLIMRARVRLNSQHFDEAEADLREAEGILAPHSEMVYAIGVHGDRARCFAALGELRSATGDHRAAVEACQQAVAWSRRVVADDDDRDAVCQVHLSRHLEQLAAAWRCAGDPTEAGDADQESRNLRDALKLPRSTGFAEAES